MFYDNLLKVCEKKGVKLTPLVVKLGLSRGNIDNWKKGTIPGGDVLIKLAEALDTTPNELLGIEKESVAENDELNELLEELKNRKDMRMLFSLAKDATPEDVRTAVKIIEALRSKDKDNG